MMKMTMQQERTWRFFLVAIGVSACAVLGSAYLLPDTTAIAVTENARNVIGSGVIDRYFARFAAYRSPANGMVGLMTVWLFSPLLLAAGYRFTADILRTSSPRIRKRSRLFTRALLGVMLFGVFAFTTVMLAGVPSTRCRGCESESMLFMLAVSIIGTVLSGAMLGGVVSDMRSALKFETIH